jgi:hypothetical protein
VDIIGVKVKVRYSKIPKMKQCMKTLNGTSVSVGVMGEQAWLARIHEYGCKIKVTDKMRAFLHKKGLHLKASTEFITIPERAFLRKGFKANEKEVLEVAKAVLCDVVSGNLSVDDYAEMVGQELSDRIADYATDLSSPANHPFTIKNKGSSNPLVDTGDMINAIGYKVER